MKVNVDTKEPLSSKSYLIVECIDSPCDMYAAIYDALNFAGYRDLACFFRSTVQWVVGVTAMSNVVEIKVSHENKTPKGKGEK